MGDTVVSETYNAVLTSTLRNYLTRKVVDNLSVGRFLRFVMRGTKMNPKDTVAGKYQGYEVLAALGERAQVPLMYASGNVDSYAGWQIIPDTPTGGLTSAFFEWRQAGGVITITGLEQEQNKGENAVINLLQTKSDQITIGLEEHVNQIMLAGNARNGNAATAYVSTATGASGPDPIAFLVHKAGTGTVGSVDSSANSWWVNQFKSYGATTYATILKELDNLYMNCALAAGGQMAPDFHLVDPEMFNLYRAALRSFARIEGYVDADLPFENIAFHGGPAFYDKWVPDANAGTTPGLGGASTTRAKGTWYMLCSPHLKILVSKAANFTPGKFVETAQQDGMASKVLWYGALALMNRGKQGVYFNVDLSVAS